ncbi:DNA-binding response regulator [Actinorhabdospora filicis]|uniref:DNA-binding response regulator n=1 Tax=Actinorhabdospora filicis TaxID=1785913 RepID=A0A9W6SHS8_9ACTN|nr:DNA-binding response regulator [Actinorhabdospora filicis]
MCVRTPAAAQRISACASRTGVAQAVRTALSSADVHMRLRERRADVVLADVALTRPDPVSFTKQVLAVAPGTGVVLVGNADPRIAALAVAAGARGVIRAGREEEDLVVALTQAIMMVCPRPNGTVPRQVGADRPGPRRGSALTEREMQVLRGMSEGKSNGEIGRDLFVSEDTVKTHARRLFRKLGARDRAHAVAEAFRSGLVS